MSDPFTVDPQIVAKMRQAGYGDDEIVGDMAQRFGDKFDFAGAMKAGYSPTEILQHVAPAGSMDVPKSMASQGAAGLMDIPAMASQGMNALGDWTQRKLQALGMLSPEEAQAQQQRFNKDFGPGPNPIAGARDAVADLHVPETRLGKVAGSAARFASSTLPMGGMAPEAILARMASGATSGAGSELAGQAAAGTGLEAPARLAGALLTPSRALNRLAGLEKAVPDVQGMSQAISRNLAAGDQPSAVRNIAAINQMQNVSQAPSFGAKAADLGAAMTRHTLYATPLAIGGAMMGHPEALAALGIAPAHYALHALSAKLTANAIKARQDALAMGSPAGAGTGPQGYDPRILRLLMASEAMHGRNP